MSAITASLKSAEETVASLGNLLGSFRKELIERRAAEFAAAGGCPRCRGRGWVVTWDTMDVADGGCADYGPCPNEAANPEAHGENAPFDHSSQSKYDCCRGVGITLARYPGEATELDSYERQFRAAIAARKDAEVAATPAWGKVVRVVKGRKVPRGTEGRVFWTGYSYSTFRLGIETLDGEKHFTAASNVEVIAIHD